MLSDPYVTGSHTIIYLTIIINYDATRLIKDEHLTFLPRWLFTRTDMRAFMYHVEWSHELSLSLLCFFSFSTWIGMSMNHLVGAYSFTLVVEEQQRCAPAPWRTTEMTASTFSLDDDVTDDDSALRSLEDSRGRCYDYWPTVSSAHREEISRNEKESRKRE